MDTYIKISNLYVKFRGYMEHMPTLAQSFLNFGNKHRLKIPDFTALENINMTVHKGDKIGIIGNNGAGKSTLLKSIAGIYQPSHGMIEVLGHLTCLLELGIGFDLTRTVIENIYLCGAINGRSKKEMKRLTSDILEFSELEQFINKPVKLLSSGMKSRLAFSIATSINPEILILDEVFAAGDAAFIRKAQIRMRELIDSSHILLFVSHSTELIREICNKVIVLHNGKIVWQGSADESCQYYLTKILKKA